MDASTILDRYEILTPLVPETEVYLVMDQETGEILIEKITSICDAGIYQNLKNNQYIGIPKVYQIADQDAKTVLIEEYIHGSNLMQLVKKQGTFSEEVLISYMIKLCGILQQFHTLSPPVIHRDIKPENIILSNESGIYLIDFNISREYKPSSELDTVAMISYHFSAPELYGFGQSDQRSDIYSIGATMHYLLTGGYLKETKYSGPLSSIITKCTALDPDDRYQSVDELKEALLGFTDSKTKPKTTDSYMIPGFRSKQPWKMIPAFIGYAFIIWFCLTLDIKPTAPAQFAVFELWAERLSVFTCVILSVFILCNYRGWMDKIQPLNKLKSMPLRMLISIVLLMSVTFFALTLFVSILINLSN